MDAGIPDAGDVDATLGDAALPDSAADAPASGALQQKVGLATAIASGDPLNSTTPVIAALADGIVLAGASSDPAVVGVSQFDAGIVSEAFLARWQHNGQAMWSVPLIPAGLPAGIAVDPSGDIVVTAAYLPGFTMVSPDIVGPDLYLGKFTPTGTTVYEKHLVLTGSISQNDSISEGGLAVDSTGAIYIAGGIVRSTTQQDILLVKYDSSGNQVWIKTFAGDPPGSGGEVDVTSITIATGDEVVITGGFTGHFDFGGGALADVSDAGFAPLVGFIARFTASGTYVSSAAFGGPTFNLGGAVTATSSGDVLLSGLVTGPVTLGGVSVPADTTNGSAFLARLDRMNAAHWATVAATTGTQPIGRAIAIDSASRAHLTGQFGGELLVDNFTTDTGTALANVSATTSDAGAGANGYSLAVDSTQSLWVAGTFDTQATFGSFVLTGSSAGVFVARLDPGGP